MRRGRKSAAQTPALKSERIYGSKKNPKGSASSEKSAKQITLSEKTMKALQNKLAEFKKSHTNKNITLNDLKAVYRRGSGAFSSSHRPNIPRNAWAMARVNKFLKKASGQKVKAAYVQDDDLMKYEDGGQVNEIILIRGEGKNTTGSVDLFGRGLYLTDSLSVAKFYGDNIKTYKIKGKIFDTSKPMSPKEFRKFCKTFDKTFNTYLGNKLLNGLIEFNDGKLPSETYDYTQISWSFDSWSEFYELLKENKLNTNEQNSYANTNTAINMALKNMGYVGLKYSTNEVEDLEENGLSGLNAFVIFDKNSIEEINNYEGGGEIGVTAKVYRGTGERVNETYGGRTDEGLGVFYTDNETMAKWFAGLIEYDVDTERYEPTGEKGKIESSTIELKNPYIIDSTHEDYDIDNQHTSWNILMEEINAKDKKEVESFVSKLVSKGYDGIVLKDNTTNYYEDGTYDIYVKFTPEQLGNSNLDIKFDDGGFIDDKMELYHGGNLDEYNDIIAQKNGRYEYGAGLYLTTHQDTARKYAKGSRKLYKITVEKGVDIHDATISVDNVNAFIKKYVISSKRKEISQRLEKWNDNGTVKANIFNNVILNEKGISASNTKNLRTFLVDNGIDYEIVDNPFGWGETMIVLYNMAKIIKVEKLDKSIYADGGLIAPNGKPSNLTAEQYELVRTPQFKKWFGDWENDPASASKVVDENGEPLVVYHGTKNNFFEFDTNKQIKGWLGRGFYFTKNKIEAKDYGNRLLKCFLNIRNLFIVEDDKVNEDGSVTFALNIKEQISQKYGSLNNADISITLKNNANDGIVYGDMISCFYSNQIKLADGTNTTFDESNDIRFADGGLIAPNGKPSNLTAEQYELVRTPQFKKWFGDWENNPESASKVVDENGEPLVVYRGNKKNQELLGYEFNLGHRNVNKKNVNDFGYFFTDDFDVAKSYGTSILSVFLNARNIIDFKSLGFKTIGSDFIEFLNEKNISFNGYENLKEQIIKYDRTYDKIDIKEWYIPNIYDFFDEFSQLREVFKKNKIEGIIFKEKSRSYFGEITYSIFESNQIKLADGTNTTFDTNNSDIRFDDGGLIAPNGKKSNLTAEQYELVRTPQFKKWFGDWENNPESASKVVDENGEPMVVYHGTRNRFDVFDIDKSGESNTLAKVGFWFTPLSKFAYNFADSSWWGKDNAFVYPVFLSIKNPKIFVSEDIIYGDSYQKYRTEVYKVAGQTEEDANTGGLGMMLNNPKETIKKYRELLSDEGYDGIIIKNTRFDKSEAGGYNDQYIALQPNQIKLAYGNTTFDSNNPNMRFAKGGKTNSMKKKGIEARGDCYYIAGQFAMDNIFTPKKIEYIGTPYLVHGEVQGQGAVSHIRYGHAWIEDDENVYDFSNGRELVIPKVVYYAIGDINPDEPTKYKKYTFAEARRKMVNTGHYGCWDLDVEYKEGGELYAESMKKYDNGGGIPSNLTNVRNSRLFIPDVRGGWTKEKIVKYFKNKLSDSISTFRLTKYISQFENWEQFKNHIYYHGTQGYIESGLKPSITMSEREAERSGGGGYGQRYYGISLTKRKRTAESFSGMSSGVTIYPVILKKDAKVIERTDLTDAADIEDIIVELYEQGIDAVWIGGGEEELVVVNPYSVLIYKDGKEYHRSYGGFKSIPLTDEKIKDIYETSKILWEEYSEEYKEKQNQEEKQSFLKSLPNIQFEKGGLIAPNGKASNLTPEQYKLVRTLEFKAWFGDWENDLENSSKVVDENGEPLVVWHYSKRLQYELDKFYVFNVDRQIGSHFGTIKQAQNLKYIPSGQSEVKTSNKEISDFRYYQVFLNIKNPIRLKDVGIFDEKTLIEAINDIEQLKDYDWEYINNYSRKSTDSLLDRVKHIAKGKGIDGAVYLNRYESDAESSYISSLDEVSDKVFKKNIPSAEDSWIAFYPEQIKLADGTNTTFDSSNDIRYKKGGRVWNDDELLKRYKRGESIGFSGIAHLKAQGLIKRADGTKRKTMADGAEVLTTAEKDLFDIYDIQTILKLQKTSFKNGGSTENLKIILVPETYQKMKTDLAALKGIGNPRIAMLDDNHNVMGGVFINEDEYECNFDIRLKDEHRHKGYNCLLIKALIKDFHDNMDVEMLVCENDFTQKLGWENGCFTRTNAKDFMRQNKHKYINYLHTDSPKIMDEFNASNQDENQDITCVGCSWNWNTSQSDKSDKYVCHQCGFDNTLFYDKNIMNRLKKPMSVPEISTKHNANEEYVLEQLQKGMKHEMEHTDDEQIAEIIALHHIGERPDYYEVLETMKLAKGGDVLEVEQEIMEYDIPEYIQSEKEFAKQVMNSDETRISRAMICKAKIDNALQNEMQVENPEEKNAWAEVNDIWKKCFYEIMSEDFHEHEEEQCGCGCQTTTYKKGGECGCDDTPTYNKGGLAYGNSHDKGGMPLTVESTGQDIEIEGGEGVINKRSMQMNKKLEFEGKEMTPCEIISKINEMGGGVKFKCADVKKIIAEDGNFD